MHREAAEERRPRDVGGEMSAERCRKRDVGRDMSLGCKVDSDCSGVDHSPLQVRGVRPDSVRQLLEIVRVLSIPPFEVAV